MSCFSMQKCRAHLLHHIGKRHRNKQVPTVHSDSPIRQQVERAEVALEGQIISVRSSSRFATLQAYFDDPGMRRDEAQRDAKKEHEEGEMMMTTMLVLAHGLIILLCARARDGDRGIFWLGRADTALPRHLARMTVLITIAESLPYFACYFQITR